MSLSWVQELEMTERLAREREERRKRESDSQGKPTNKRVDNGWEDIIDKDPLPAK